MSKLLLLAQRILPNARPLGNFCFLAAIIYLGLMPLPHFERHTYISENALMPDYGSPTYSDNYRQDLVEYAGKLMHCGTEYFETVHKIATNVSRHQDLLQLTSVGKHRIIHTVIESERSDGTEALALVAPLYNRDGKKNTCGVSTVLALAKAFSEFKFWARDILVIFPESGVEGLNIWLDAYISGKKDGIKRRAGTIQFAVNFEIDGTYCDTGFDFCSVELEGPNGLLPNLDSLNTMVKIAEPRGLVISIGGRFGAYLLEKYYRYPYAIKLANLVSMIIRQATGYPRHAHGPLLTARIDSYTLTAQQSKRRENDDFHRFKHKRFYETVEGTFRSMNNVLERLHQSYFFYLLTNSSHFISIANFLPLSALLAASLLLKGAASLHEAGFSSPVMEVGFSVAMILANFILWIIPRQLLSLHTYTIFAILFAIPVIFFAATKRFMCLVPMNKKTFDGTILVILAIVVFSCIFLNFSLSFLLGIISAAFSALPSNNGALLPKFLLLPSSLLLIAAAWRETRTYAIEILSSPSDWNFGIPFLIIQPLFILLLCIRSKNGEDDVQDGKNRVKTD